MSDKDKRLNIRGIVNPDTPYDIILIYKQKTLWVIIHLRYALVNIFII